MKEIDVIRIGTDLFIQFCEISRSFNCGGVIRNRVACAASAGTEKKSAERNGKQ
jgi:hypothetical protein